LRIDTAERYGYTHCDGSSYYSSLGDRWFTLILFILYFIMTHFQYLISGLNDYWDCSKIHRTKSVSLFLQDYQKESLILVFTCLSDWYLKTFNEISIVHIIMVCSNSEVLATDAVSLSLSLPAPSCTPVPVPQIQQPSTPMRPH
jgi:hypothetical protein